MPASTVMRADDAQYDNPLRGTLLHREGPPVAGIRAADDEIIRGGGQAGRPEPGAWVIPARCDSIPDSRAFPRRLAEARLLRYPGQRLAPKASDWHHRNPATAPAPADRPGWPAPATFRSLSRPGTDEGHATKEGNKR
jgi:hypothetical protein